MLRAFRNLAITNNAVIPGVLGVWTHLSEADRFVRPGEATSVNTRREQTPLLLEGSVHQL